LEEGHAVGGLWRRTWLEGRAAGGIGRCRPLLRDFAGGGEKGSGIGGGGAGGGCCLPVSQRRSRLLCQPDHAPWLKRGGRICYGAISRHLELEGEFSLLACRGPHDRFSKPPQWATDPPTSAQPAINASDCAPNPTPNHRHHHNHHPSLAIGRLTGRRYIGSTGTRSRACRSMREGLRW